MNKEIKWLLYWMGGSIILGIFSGELFSKVSVLTSSLVLSLPAFLMGYYLVEHIINNPNRKLFPHVFVFLGLVLVSLVVYSVLFMDV